MSDRRPTTLSEPVAAGGLVVLAAACAGLLFAQPRPVVPQELPSLLLPADEVRRVIEHDRVIAARVPASPEIERVEALLRAHGRAQAAFFEDQQSHDRRRASLRAACTILARSGPDVVAALRARWVERLEDALALRLSAEEVPEVLGAFALTLERGGVTEDGVIVGPHFVVRTLYKAQWNASCGFAPASGLAPVERVAYHGWQAFHVPALSAASRLAALDAYAAAGGRHADEAQAVVLLGAGDAVGATGTMQAAYAAEGSIRLRNHVLALQVVAGTTP